MCNVYNTSFPLIRKLEKIAFLITFIDITYKKDNVFKILIYFIDHFMTRNNELAYVIYKSIQLYIESSRRKL